MEEEREGQEIYYTVPKSQFEEMRNEMYSFTERYRNQFRKLAAFYEFYMLGVRETAHDALEDGESEHYEEALRRIERGAEINRETLAEIRHSDNVHDVMQHMPGKPQKGEKGQ